MNNNLPKNNTPNLDKNLKKLYGKKRVKWGESINFEQYNNLQEFDLSHTFLKDFNYLICAVARKISDRELELLIYRYDKEDNLLKFKEFT